MYRLRVSPPNPMTNSECGPVDKVSERTTLLLYKTSRTDFNTSKSNVELILVTPSNSMKVVLERRWGNKSSYIEKLHLLKQSRPNK
jgi:hypothetical protein